MTRGQAARVSGGPRGAEPSSEGEGRTRGLWRTFRRKTLALGSLTGYSRHTTWFLGRGEHVARAPGVQVAVAWSARTFECLARMTDGARRFQFFSLPYIWYSRFAPAIRDDAAAGSRSTTRATERCVVVADRRPATVFPAIESRPIAASAPARDLATSPLAGSTSMASATCDNLPPTRSRGGWK